MANYPSERIPDPGGVVALPEFVVFVVRSCGSRDPAPRNLIVEKGRPLSKWSSWGWEERFGLFEEAVNYKCDW